MTAHTVLYSATEQEDYRFIAFPDSGCIPDNVAYIFKKRIICLLKDERQMITSPMRMFDREIYDETSYILWGIACRNAMLSNAYAKDEFMREIQCFIGFTTVENEKHNIKSPYDTDTFRNAFNSIMSSNWSNYASTPVREKNTLEECNAFSLSLSQIEKHLNYSQSLCRFFPSNSGNSPTQLFLEAFSSRLAVSIVSNVKSQQDVTDPEYAPYMNAILLSGQDSIKDIPVTHKCRNCLSYVKFLQDGLCEKCYDNEQQSEDKDSLNCSHRSFTAFDSIDDLCPDCYHKSKAHYCSQFGRIIKYAYKDWKCKIYHSAIRHKRLLLITIIIIVAIIIICLKYVPKTYILYE